MSIDFVDDSLQPPDMDPAEERALIERMRRAKAPGGASGPEMQAAMSHANIKTSARYIHFAEARRNELAERAASVATAGMKAAVERQAAKPRSEEPPAKR